MICLGVFGDRRTKRKLIINLKMLINLITVFIFIALPLTSSPLFRFFSEFWQLSLCICVEIPRVHLSFLEGYAKLQKLMTIALFFKELILRFSLK